VAEDLRDPYEPQLEYADALSMVVAAQESAELFAQSYVDKVERRYRAYRGISELKVPEGEEWRSRLTTPYILQTVEGMIATMLDPNPMWNVTPRPHPYEPLEVIMARLGAGDIASHGLQWAMDNDDFAMKQRPFMQQDLVAGKTVAKIGWRTKKTKRMVLTPVEARVMDEYGTVIDTFPSNEEEEKEVTVFDGPTMTVRDVRDFFRPESANNVDDAAWVIDRSWQTYNALEEKQRAGLYKNCEQLKESQNIAAQTGYGEREQLLRNQDRTKGLIEVLEYWTDERVVTVGNRKVVLQDIPNPYRHGRKPFVVTSAMPDAFQMDGISVVEALGQMQQMLWTIQNQAIDNVRLAGNSITLIRSDVDDPDSFEFHPGAQWFVEDIQQVMNLPVDPNIGNTTIQREQLIKGDLQNVMGGLPMAGGVSSGTIDQTTATGMSIITSIAQKIIQARKQHYTWAYEQIGEQFLQVMGQMLRGDRAISVMGKEGNRRLLLLSPLDIQGDFDVKISVMDDSMMRQEKRAEEQAKLQTAANVSQILPLNMKAFMEDFLKSYGVQDTERYFSHGPGTVGAAASAQPPGSAPGGMGSPPSPEAPSGPPVPGNPAGMTAPPGGGLSMTPDTFAQSQLAQVGRTQ
jgi:hypothetical protein